MDWEYRVVNEEAKRLAKALLPYAAEDFLLRFSNQGIYKRAVKDLASLKSCVLEAEGTALKVKLDDICVILPESLAQSRCSCPSKAVCKHKVMAILCAAQFIQELSGEAEEEGHSPKPAVKPFSETEPQTAAKPYEALKILAPDELKKRVGKRVFTQALHTLRQSGKAEVTEKEGLLAVKLSGGISVYFPPQDSVERAVCQCGAAEFCRHKIAAVAAYWEQNGLFLEETSHMGQDNGLKELFQEADRHILQLLDKGLAFTVEQDCQWAEQLSLRFETQGVGNLSRMFRRLSTELSYLMQKNAAFQRQGCFALLANLHNRLRLLLQRPDDPVLAGQLLEGSRSEYFLNALGHFIGLGAYPWRAKSGYCGITALLWHEEKACMCTYTSSRPEFYKEHENQDVRKALNACLYQNAHWADGASLALIASRRFVLRQFKLNRQNRISASSKTGVLMQKAVSLEDLLALPLSQDTDDFLSRQKPFAYFARRRPEEVYLAAANGLEQLSFDSSEQKLTWYFSTVAGNRIRGEIPYSPLTEPAIRFLEQAEKKSFLTPAYFICLLRNHIVYPVSLADENGIRNFYFDS